MGAPKRIVVNDTMQHNYAYCLTEPAGRNFHRDFKPELTPKQMLQLGVFGGRYMTDCCRSSPPAGSPAPSCRRTAMTRG